MTRLVKRHMGGGWMAAIDAVGKIGSTVGNYFTQQAIAKKQKEIALANREQALAELQTAEWRAKAAAAAGQFDRNGEGAVTMAINNGLRTMPYDNGAMTPGYTAAAQPQTNPSVVNSGVLSGVVSSFFKEKNNDNTTDDGSAEENKFYQDATPLPSRKDKEALEGEVQTLAEEKPAITGEEAQATAKTLPAGGGERSDMKVAGEKAKTDKSKEVKATSAGSTNTGKVAAKDGCKLKKRFNPRLFKKQK